MTPLAEKLARRIRQSGPITVAEYFAAALGDPEHGYYMTRDPFGAGGDFVTAPEVSQVFGELLGLWCAALWVEAGRPALARLVELGPGRGTLMADALRAIGKSLPAFRQALTVHLVETSPVLTERQRAVLADTHPEFTPVWHETFDTVPPGPLFLIANEFFDALPVRQFVRQRRRWRERRVDIDETGASFRFVLAAPGAMPPLPADAADGAIVEICDAGNAIAGQIARRLRDHGGDALIIDYGPDIAVAGDTLQAVRRHAFAQVLDQAGEVDLTHYVDFTALRRAAETEGASAFGPVPQAVLLTRLGVEARARSLAARTTPAQAADLHAALTRLIHPRQMGLLFKALAITRTDAPPPPGFDG